MLHEDETPKECSDPFHSDVPQFIPETEILPAPEPQPAPAAAQAPKKGNPVCPYCSTESGIMGMQIQMGPFSIMVIRCPNEDCRKILGAFPLGMAGPVQIPGRIN